MANRQQQQQVGRVQHLPTQIATSASSTPVVAPQAPGVQPTLLQGQVHTVNSSQIPLLSPGQVPTTQIVFIQAPPTVGHITVYENYAAKTSRILGNGKISIGLLSILFQIIAMIVERPRHAANVSFIGTGIWCGLWFILAGSFGRAAAEKKTFCLIITNMVLAIISVSIFGLIYVALSATALGMADSERRFARFYDLYGHDVTKTKGLIALYSLMLIVALIECVFEIWTSIICCKAVCCGQPTSAETYVQYSTNTGQQVLCLQGLPTQQQSFTVTQPPQQALAVPYQQFTPQPVTAQQPTAVPYQPAAPPQYHQQATGSSRYIPATASQAQPYRPPSYNDVVSMETKEGIPEN